MTLNEFKFIVERIKYKPNFKIAVAECVDAAAVDLKIVSYSWDRNNIDSITNLVKIHRISYSEIERWDTSRVIECVLSLIQDFEEHERDLWFRVE